jgi:thiosulfate/3-mercaptopyruvate sulfurtransferase
MPFETLIDAAALAAFKGGDLRIVDCRAVLGDPAAGRAAYDAGHIPGAVHADLETDLSGPRRPGTGRHPLPDPDRLAAKFGAWGIDERTQIVAYDALSGAFAARLWWLARWLGHEVVAVLDGGFADWQRHGLPVTPTPMRPEPKVFRRRPALTREVDANRVLDPAAALLDARAEARYRGETEPIDPVAGHIPGAQCVPFEGNLDANGRFLPAAVLRARFAAVGAETRPVICYCGSGVTACHNVLALKIAGFDEPSLYAGSWSEWITDPTRPIA